MIFVPFVFFLLLTVFFAWKHGLFDVCVYMSALHMLTSVMAIFIVYGNLMGDGGILYGNSDANFGVVPTLLYCVMLGVSILPFSLLYGRDLKRISIRAEWSVDALSWVLIAVSFLNLYLVADSTLDILQGDLAAVRQSLYDGQQSPAQIKSETLPFALKFLYYFNHSTLLALPLFFYNLCLRQKPWWLNGLLLFASLSVPLAGIQVADRTEFVFYGLMVIFCLLFFRPFFTRRIKRVLLLVGSPIVLIAVAYVTAVSQSRFDDKGKSSSFDRNIQYAGQAYPNFCFFYDKANFDYVAIEREFPLFSHYVLKQDSDADRRSARTGKQGFYISVFASFIGDIMLDIGPLGMVIWVIYYALLCLMVLRRARREEFDISEVLLIFWLSIVPIFGIFYYRFYFFTHTFALLLVLAMRFFSRYKITLR